MDQERIKDMPKVFCSYIHKASLNNSSGKLYIHRLLYDYNSGSYYYNVCSVLKKQIRVQHTFKCH